VSSSPIAGSFYFAGQGNAAVASAAQSPQATGPAVADEAARAWSVIQNTTSMAVIEDFIRQFGTTAYGSMARARLAEMKKSQVAVATPKPAPPRAESSFLVSGKYDVTASGIASDFTITVNGASFSGSSKWSCCPGPRTDPIVNGQVQNGRITFTRICDGQGQVGACRQSYAGSITANGASGEWSGTGGGGSWTMHRH
jgi:hypothetical protein